MVPNASLRTQAKLEYNGKRARVGDRETGVWEVEITHWYRFGDGYIYLTKGTRLKATWTFSEDDKSASWRLSGLDLDTIIAPRSKERPTRLKRRHWGRLILTAAVVAFVISWLLGI
jgi:hypothetical protein